MKNNIRFSLESQLVSFFAEQSRSLAVIFALVLAAFSNIFLNDFIHDDFDFIVHWDLIRDLRNIPRFFFGYMAPEGQSGVYSPLRTLIFSLNYQLWGQNPAGYHLTALLTHWAGVYCVYRLALVLARDSAIAFFTALFFGVHPVHVESVTSMTGSVDTSGVVFMFAAFYYYILAFGDAGRLAVGPAGPVPALSKNLFSNRDYRRALFWGTLAIWTHELTLALPFLLLFYDVFFGAGANRVRARAARLAPFFVMGAVYVFMKGLNFGSISRGRYLFDSVYLTMLVLVKALARYFGVLLFPFTLTHNPVISPGIFAFDVEDFDRQAVLSQSLVDPQVLWSLGLLAAAVLLSVIYRKKHPVLSFCAGFFFLSLLPVLQLVPSSVYYAERYLYPGSFAFCLLVVYGLYHVYRRSGERVPGIRRGVAAGLCLVFLVFYAGRTFARNFDYRNAVTAFEKAVAINPESAYLRNDLGVLYLQAGEVRKSLASFRAALKIKPDQAHIYFSAAQAYIAAKDFPAAEAALKQAVILNPDFAEAYFNLAGIYAQLDRMGDTEAALKRAVTLFARQERILEAGELLMALSGYLKIVPDNAAASGIPE